jgi:uncharacterized sporulation protein YeaH/YhbH (DUF444 family)
MTIIDRRKTGKNKSVGNRQKFIKRYKSRIKRSVDEIASEKGITDILGDRKVVIDQDEIDEPNFNFDMTTGERDVIFTGNKTLQKGDKIHRPPPDDGEENEGSDTGEGFDEFSFTLTKEEFLDLYFSDMALPAFIKESMKGSVKQKMKRSGYSKEGIPPRLDLLKTLKQAMARRMATGSERYLDDIDLRYKHFTKHPFPVKQATMILLMDVSGSMGEFEKGLAKKFFLLLYLFLNKCYKHVEVVFISHTQEAAEVTEHEFFYGTQTGGTIVSSGLQMAKDIIDTRINLNETNVYISQASDGDNWGEDSEEELVHSLMEDLLSKVQYFAYIQTEHPSRLEWKTTHGVEDTMTVYKELESTHKNLKAKHVCYENEVYPVLRSLFEE